MSGAVVVAVVGSGMESVVVIVIIIIAMQMLYVCELDRAVFALSTGERDEVRCCRNKKCKMRCVFAKGVEVEGQFGCTASDWLEPASQTGVCLLRVPATSPGYAVHQNVIQTVSIRNISTFD